MDACRYRRTDTRTIYETLVYIQQTGVGMRQLSAVIESSDSAHGLNGFIDVKLTKFQEKLLALMKETSDEQVKVETENRNNFNGVSVTLQNEQNRLGEKTRVSASNR